MDIQVSSNLARLLYDAGGRDGALFAAHMSTVELSTALQLTNAQRQSFLADKHAFDFPPPAEGRERSGMC